jgi:hypothetical protein
MTLRVLIAICALLVGGTAMAEADYRTVVIFGDTQELVEGAPDKDNTLYPRNSEAHENLENLKRTIDWVIGNRKSENIDFVLHVGDIIQSGYRLATPISPKCYVQGKCQSQIEYEAGRKCPCSAERNVDMEWERFNWVWRRLDGIVPYAIVRGNHDNVGGHSLGERPGFRDYYGAQQMAKLPGYVESSSFEDVGHVWKFRLGAHPVLVIGLPDSARFELAQADWANEVLSRPENREIPAILLAHRFFDGVPVDYNKPFKPWTEIVERRPEQIFMTVWGHVSPGRVRMVKLNGKKVLDIRSNWQTFVKGPNASTVNLVRFKLGKHGIESVSVEAFARSAGFDTSAFLAQTRLTTRPFRVPLKGLR